MYPSSDIEKRGDRSLRSITQRKNSNGSSSVYNGAVLSQFVPATNDYNSRPSSVRKRINLHSVGGHKPADKSIDTAGSSTGRKSGHKSRVAKAVLDFHHQRKSLSKMTGDLTSRPQTSGNIPFARELNSFNKSQAKDKRIQSGNHETRRGEGERKGSNRPSSTAGGIPTRDKVYSTRQTSRFNSHEESGNTEIPLADHRPTGDGSKVYPTTVSIMLNSSSESRPTSRQHQPKPLQLRYYSNYKRGLF